MWLHNPYDVEVLNNNYEAQKLELLILYDENACGRKEKL